VIDSERAPARWGDRLLQLFGLRLFVWCYLAALLSGGVLRQPFNVTSHYDEHYFFAHEEAARISLVRYHELPAWNPYYCGGIPLAANPQDVTFAPDFLLRVIFDTGPGRRLAILLFIMLGLEGMYRLARRHDCSALASAAAAVAFAGSGRFFFMLDFGWINMFGFHLLPFTVLALEEGARSWRWRLVGGAFLGWMLLNGGTYTVPYTALVLALLTVFDVGDRIARGRAGWWRPALSLVTIGGVAVALSAVKLFPMLKIIALHPRPIDARHANGIPNLIESLVVAHGGKGDRVEAYVSAGVLILAVVALLFRDRAAVRFMTMALLFFGLAAGDADAGRLSLYTILHKFPLYGQLRDPERFTLVVAFFLALSTGRALSHFEDLPLHMSRLLRDRFLSWRKKPAREELGLPAYFLIGFIGSAIVLVSGVAIAVDVIAENHVRPDLFSQDPPLAHAQEFRQSRGNRWDAQVWPRAGLGTLQCFEETKFPQSALLRGDLKSEEYAEKPETMSVERISWSPNRVRLHVVAKEPGVVRINQNFDSGWSTDVGEVKGESELLTVLLPAGDHQVTLAYRDPLVTVGFACTVLTTLTLLFFFAKWGRGKMRQSLDKNSSSTAA
jgi:hypothetical protein